MRPYTYFYNEQVRTYIKQFLRVFTGIQVQYGVDRDEDGNLDRRAVNVVYGDMDRVIANVLTQNGDFTNKSLPLISGYMRNISLTPERRKPRQHVENVPYTKEDGSTGVSSRLMSIPYQLNMELAIWTSNTDQSLQILEQILLMFNPQLIFQKSENIHDWSYLVKAELTGINNEANYPAGTDSRMKIDTLNFDVDIWLNYPMSEYQSVIEQASLTAHDDGISIDDVTVTG